MTKPEQKGGSKPKKKENKLWAIAFLNELGTPRMVVGEKVEGEEMKNFITDRAIQQINRSPLNKFDAVSNYQPIVGVEINLGKVFDENPAKKQKPAKIGDEGYKSPVKEEYLAKYLRDQGWVCYKKSQKEQNNDGRDL